MRRTALALFLAVASTAAAQSPSTEAITTRDGRRYVGVVTAHGKALRIRTPLRDIYLSTANVAERKAAPAPPPPPIFRRNAELLAKPKKAKVGMVVDKITWGRWLAVDRLEGSFVDFELGKLQTVFVISQITPYSVRMESVDYDKIFEFELKTFANVLPQLIEVGAGNAPATLAKQVRFYRLAGMHDRARAVIGRLRKVAPDHAAITAEQLAMETQRLRRTLDDADRLARSGRVAEAAKVLADRPPPSS